MENNKKLALFISLAAFFIGMMFVGGCLLVSDLTGKSAPVVGGGNASAQKYRPGVGPNEISNIVKSAGPAVVKISTIKINQVAVPYSNDPLFRYFFGDQMPSKKSKETGIGSGFIISEDGTVITNQHVISGATEIKVTIGGKDMEYLAEVIGADYDLDLAVLKLKGASNLPHLKIGSSEDIKVGNWVIAIGNPFGFDHTVTVGVISAKGRPVTVENRRYKDLLQTDAAINPGNSGGPLINLDGEVIGINTAVARAQGIGFAIPTKTVKGVLDQLLEKGKVSHPWLGIQMTNLTPDVAHYFNLESDDGIVIRGVVPGSPADKAGLKQWDIALKINGQKTKTTQDLANVINNMEIGEKGNILIYRNGCLKNISFAVGEKPKQWR
ncbi:MAG: trypsin-like peptidase domain-containing protein [Clostridiales bacterium]|nr:trypsin-like peptidase domain-containing protein [Clostridiales bacterium]MCF8021379.1 trypsin-like peptidase domain-containing protein [Clostridiales bacterium]